ncbi:hypothetical protein [Streptomyces sp.]|uniref:hypothetical protein n=1 Tax=Streptomyces sp. TaxID=1931 RepID=UPI002F404460
MELERQSLWEEEPAASARLPDPVRAAAVRAVLVVAVALIAAVIELLLVAGHSWLTAPMMPFTVLISVAATWAVLDVWVTRQVWNQRNGVVSSPSSAARARRGEQRGAPPAAARGREGGQAEGQPGAPTGTPAGGQVCGQPGGGPHIPRPHGV